MVGLANVIDIRIKRDVECVLYEDKTAPVSEINKVSVSTLYGTVSETQANSNYTVSSAYAYVQTGTGQDKTKHTISHNTCTHVNTQGLTLLVSDYNIARVFCKERYASIVIEADRKPTIDATTVITDKVSADVLGSGSTVIQQQQTRDIHFNIRFGEILYIPLYRLGVTDNTVHIVNIQTTKLIAYTDQYKRTCIVQGNVYGTDLVTIHLSDNTQIRIRVNVT